MIFSIFLTLMIFMLIIAFTGHGEFSQWVAIGLLYVLHFNNKNAEIDKLRAEIDELTLKPRHKTISSAQVLQQVKEKESEEPQSQLLLLRLRLPDCLRRTCCRLLPRAACYSSALYASFAAPNLCKLV